MLRRIVALVKRSESLGDVPAASGRSERMALQLHSADFVHDDGITYCIRRNSLEEDFTIFEKRGDAWVDCGLDQAVQELNFSEFKRLGLLIKRIMDAGQWVA